MSIASFIDYFIHPFRFESQESLRRARLLVRGSLITSLFSIGYLMISLFFDFDPGKYLLITNAMGFLFLPFLIKTRLPINLLGNLYIFIGAYAVIVLCYFSGGVDSALYAWIIAIPICALLVVNRKSAYYWGIISLAAMLFIGWGSISGYEYPVAYNTSLRAEWLTSIYTGLLLLFFFIMLAFEYTQSRALSQLGNQNAILAHQKRTISKQKEKLAGLIEEKDYIIRILAHDLRSPLNNIKGLVKLMEMEASEQDMKEYRALILQTTLGAENLVNKVLEMDKAEHEELHVQMTALDILPLLDQLSQKMQELANRKNIKITLHNNTVKSRIKADKTYLNLIFENLLSNAIKFSEPHTSVEIKLSNTAEKLKVEVMDQGPGISPKEENKLFKKFSKLSTKPTAGETSTGLGLSLVKRYTEFIKGEVRHEKGKDNIGANFIVEIPLTS